MASFCGGLEGSTICLGGSAFRLWGLLVVFVFVFVFVVQAEGLCE